ncbi:unnamed protein product [Onchocerca ochengi]|uniref:Kinectin n=1 Tax=Onchocerca ochengi TaxID=42157 RepID=A0A182EF32_ONCOC|nr:unnamed protein product [Onchocerca ochengi]
MCRCERGNLSAKECSLEDQEEISTKNKKEVKKQRSKKPNETEDSSKEAATGTSQVEKRLTNLSSNFAVSTISMKQETTPKKEMEKSPKILQIKSCVTSSSQTLLLSTASMKQEMSPKKETEKKDTKVDVQEKPEPSKCPNCQVMRSEVLILSTKEDDTKQEKSSSSTETDNEDEETNKWKTRCEKLREKIKVLQEASVEQIRAFELKAEQNINERDVLLAKLTEAQEKVSTLGDLLEKQKEKNVQLSNAIQNMQLKATDELEKQKQKQIRTSEANLTMTEQLYRSSQIKVKQLETMLAKAHNDNMELRRRLELATGDVKDVKVGKMEPKEFNRWLEKKLSSIMEKFRVEAKNSDLAWMGEENIQFALDGFEAAIKIIIDDDPHLGSLAERLLVFMEAKNKEEQEPGEPPHSNVDKESCSGAKVSMDFKAEMSAEIQLILENFHMKQAEKLSENVCRIMKHLENAEQKIDNSVVRRMDNLGDLLVVIDSKQNDLQMIEKRINAKLEALSETVEDFSNKAIMENESRATEMENFGAEKHDMRAGLVYAEQLGIRQMDFENRLRNLEKQYNKLSYPTLEQPRVFIREETRRPEIDYSDMVEWPPRHWTSSGSKKVEDDEKKGQKNPIQHKATVETAEGKLNELMS